MVNVTSISDMGAYVTLLEYDDIEVIFSDFLKKQFNLKLYCLGNDFVVRAVQKTY